MAILFQSTITKPKPDITTSGIDTIPGIETGTLLGLA